MRTFAFGLAMTCLLAAGRTAFAQEVVSVTPGVHFDPQSRFEPLFGRGGKTMPAARGYWRADAYGYLFEITDDEIHLFSETASHVWKQNNSEYVDAWVKLDTTRNVALISEHNRVPPELVRRIHSIPQTYRPNATWTRVQLFEVFAETMNENYAFFQEHAVDWNARLNKFQPQVTNDISEAALFELMLRSLDGIEDAHLHLSAKINGETQQSRLGLPSTLVGARTAFESQTEVDDFDSYLQLRMDLISQGIAGKILRGDVNQTCNQFVWGKTVNNVGYLMIAGMSGFADDQNRQQELTILHNGLNEILTELADTRALIIDVSTNGGGADQYSIAIASHFYDQRRLAFSKGPGSEPEIKHSIYVDRPSDQQAVIYNKPIYLVTSDITVSAAEIFVLCMKDLPDVTTIGTTTRGALSDILSKTLPNGWNFGLSNEIYRDSKGVCYEAVGIPPKQSRSILNPAQADAGHAAAILEIANSIQ